MPPFPKEAVHTVAISLALASAKWQLNVSWPGVNCAPRGTGKVRRLLHQQIQQAHRPSVRDPGGARDTGAQETEPRPRDWRGGLAVDR